MTLTSPELAIMQPSVCEICVSLTSEDPDEILFRISALEIDLV